NRVATRAGGPLSGQRASCSTTIRCSLIGCHERGISLIPDRTTQSPNSWLVICPAPFGPSTTTGSLTVPAASIGSPRFTASCQQLIAASSCSVICDIYAIRIYIATFDQLREAHILYHAMRASGPGRQHANRTDS